MAIMSKKRGKSKFSKNVLFNTNKHVFRCEKSLGTLFYGQPSYFNGISGLSVAVNIRIIVLRDMCGHCVNIIFWKEIPPPHSEWNLTWVASVGRQHLGEVVDLKPHKSPFLPLGVASCCASIQLVPCDAVNCNKVSIRQLPVFYFPSHSLHVSAPTGHLQVRYTIRYS
jgi:hypothetical protein